jgi:hypothetical protein
LADPIAYALALLAGCMQAGGVIITSAADLKGHLGEQVDVKGPAFNAKLGPIVEVDKVPVYCLEIPEWPASMMGKPAVVHGKLELTEEFKAPNPYAAGTGGAVFVLRGCKSKPM